MIVIMTYQQVEIPQQIKEPASCMLLLISHSTVCFYHVFFIYVSTSKE